MKAATSQAVSHASSRPMLEPRLIAEEDKIEIPAGILTTAEAVVFRDKLTECVNCNVATFVAKKFEPKTKTLWDSITDPKVKTVEVDLKIVTDFLRLMECGDSLEKVVLGLINFYSDADQLNIILLPDCLAERKSYTRYTNQFALTLRTTQSLYETVKVLPDVPTGRLGIFCRKAGVIPMRTAFVQTIAEALENNPLLIIPIEKLPQTYKTNFATLKYQLKNLMPNKKISVEKSEKEVIIKVLT